MVAAGAGVFGKLWPSNLLHHSITRYEWFATRYHPQQMYNWLVFCKLNELSSLQVECSTAMNMGFLPV